MKRKFLPLVLILLLGIHLPALAGAPTKSAIPDIATEIAGFVVTAVDHMDANDSNVVVLEHIQTGAFLYWLANDHIQRSFTIGFRTPVYNDTGVAHITEHLVLTGSEKYPGANVSLEMSNKTGNTFLNAYTNQSITMYPMSSNSEEQLLITMDYYLNGIFYPNFMTDTHSFMREGWRYVLENRDEDITLTGIVYNEMKGNLTLQSQAHENSLRAVFPGSFNVSNSGGDPDDIPSLQLDDLRTFYKTYYHPSNSMSILSGDIDLERILAFLDREYFSAFEKREIPIEDRMYTPLKNGIYRYRFEYPASSDTSSRNTSVIYYSIPIHTEDLQETCLANFLVSYLRDSNAPFLSLLNRYLPHLVGGVILDFNTPQPVIHFIAIHANEEDKDKFRSIVQDSLNQVLREGIRDDLLKKLLYSTRYNTIYNQKDSQFELTLSQNMLFYWSLDGNRDNWKIFDEFDGHILDSVTNEKLSELAKKCFSAPETSILSVTIPVPGLSEKKEAALKRSLANRKAAMSEAEIDALVADTQEFNDWQEAESAIHMSPQLNALTVEALPEELSIAKVTEAVVNGIRFIVSESESPLISISVFLDSTTIPFEDLLDYIQFISIINTRNPNYYMDETFSVIPELVSNGIEFTHASIEFGEEHRMENYMVISWDTFSETQEDSFKLVKKILNGSNYPTYDYIRTQAAKMLYEYIIIDESRAAEIGSTYGAAPFSQAASFARYKKGAERKNYLRALSKMNDEELDTLIRKFADIQNLLLNSNNAIVSISCSQQNLLKTELLAYDLVSGLDNTPHERFDYTKEFPEMPRNIGIVVDENVAYNLVCTDLEQAGYKDYDVKLSIVQQIVGDKILLPEIRYKIGAYSAYASNLPNFSYISCLGSYRDPEVVDSFEVFRSVGETLRTLDITEEELDQYIINNFANIQTTWESEDAIRAKIIGVDIAGITLQRIRDAQSMTSTDIADYADLFDAMSAETGVRVTVGPQSMIEANAELYDVIIYDFLGAEEEEAVLEEETVS